MEHRKRIQTRSPRSDWPANEPVGRYVLTDLHSSRSLRSDRPSHSFGRYVATDPSRTRSLRSDRTVSDIDQRVRPKSVHSRMFLNASSHVPQPYHFSHHSDQSYRWNFTIKTARTCFCRKENRNKRFMSKDGPTRSKTRLQAHLRFFKNELVDTMAVYVFIL